jgi:CHASE2 domain-containing sensor protein
MLQLRPEEPPDSRVLVVLITDQDVQAQPQAERRGSLSDLTFEQLLQTLELHQPRAIGLDIYRDYPVGKAAPKLAERLRHSDRLVAVCKVGTSQADQGVAPPPEMPASHIGFSDVVFDADRVVRRHLLAMTPTPSSRCVAEYALSVQLALRYLDAKGLALSFPNSDTWQLGQRPFQRLKNRTSGYHTLDDWGHQILLNYRAARSPEAGIRQVTLGALLAGQVNPSAIRDRLVLIGTTAEGTHDYWLTPYHTPQGNRQSIPGVILQAQMTSQLLSAALDGRPLLWGWPPWAEALWIVAWASLGSTLALFIRKPTYLGLALLGAISALGSSSLCLLVQFGAWVPLLPAAMVLLVSGFGISRIATRKRARLNNSH